VRCVLAVAIDVRQPRQAVPYLLKALVSSSQAEKSGGVDADVVEYIKGELTTLVSAPGGVAALMEELHSAADSPAALVFLAQTLKDFGGVDASVDLYERAYKVPDAQKDPSKLANMALNLAHTQEVPHPHALTPFAQRVSALQLSACAVLFRIADRVPVRRCVCDAVRVSGEEPGALLRAERPCATFVGRLRRCAGRCPGV
jgi:hypothetical protein